MKRFFDSFFSLIGLVFFSPLLLIVMFLVWWDDGGPPFYISSRIGFDSRPFKMVKLRSMSLYADSSGVDSTALNDPRITPIGKFIRNYKLDELVQLWNVLLGDMSLVGPRPNVEREVSLYTSVERRLLSVRPGITDFASIVFSDEGVILMNNDDPDLAYHQLIRPGKSALGLFYVDNCSLLVDICLIFLTILSIFSRNLALFLLLKLLKWLDASPEICDLASRKFALLPMCPPGSSWIVTSRDVPPSV